jgi:alginate O-acetyltransferase complex protein AlgI
MLFNSVDFALFLPVIFVLYWFVVGKNLRLQNLLLLFASYFFYACWDYRFLFLLIFSTLLDFVAGIRMSEAQTRQSKRFWFWLSIAINLGFLGVFKYYNFFAESFAEALSLLGFKANFWTLRVILPVGISFYTFHGLSYVIDIYFEKIKPEKDFINYAVFVCFFPLLVAGPIERATHLLPQIKRTRFFDSAQATDGLRQIIWGLFKKIVIADNCAQYANTIFNNEGDFAGSTHLLGAIFFAFQIYCDFSGYSDIALGVARIFGIELLRNFAFPYFSRDIAEFWRRWHISLSSWFRDYLYIPLGGSKVTKLAQVRNIYIIFLVSGFWHGANWTFIVWGALHAMYFLPLMLLNRNRKNTDSVAAGKTIPNVRELFQMGTTFFLVVIAWIFFRAESLSHAYSYLKNLFSSTLFRISLQDIKKISVGADIVYLVVLITVFILVEWIQREKQHALQFQGIKMRRPVRWGIYYTIIILIYWFQGNQQEFIYFQF